MKLLSFAADGKDWFGVAPDDGMSRSTTRSGAGFAGSICRRRFGSYAARGERRRARPQAQRD